MAKTYHCGTGGIVRRLDNYSGNWVDISITAAITLNSPHTSAQGEVPDLLDIMVNPANENHVIVVGTLHAIYRSTDAGNNWTHSQITYQNDNVVNASDRTNREVWWATEDVVYITGVRGLILKSIDGGASFYPLRYSSGPFTSYSQPNVFGNNAWPACALSDAGPDEYQKVEARTLHFINDKVGIVVLSGERSNGSGIYRCEVWKTYNGGQSWTQVYEFSQLDANKIKEVGGSRIFDITNQPNRIVLTGSVGNYLSIDDGATFVRTDYPQGPWQSRIGYHLTSVPDDYRWLWATGKSSERWHSQNGGLSYPNNTPTGQQDFIPSGQDSRAAMFHSQTNGFFSKGKNLFYSTDAGVSATLSDSIESGYIEAVWTQDSPICYRLVDCEGLLDDIYTTDNMSGYLGGVVTIDGYANCWEVYEAPAVGGVSPCDTDPTDPVTIIEDGGTDNALVQINLVQNGNEAVP